MKNRSPGIVALAVMTIAPAFSQPAATVGTGAPGVASYATVQDAVNACPAGGVLNWGSGQRVSATTITLPTNYDCTWIGQATILTVSAANSYILRCAGSLRSIALSGIVFDGGGTNGGIACGSGPGSLSGMRASNVTFRNMGSSFAISCGNNADTYACSNITVDHSVFASTGGMMVYDPDNVQVTDNRFATVHTRDAIHLYGRNCGSNFVTQCGGRNLLVSNNYATGLDRMFLECQGNFDGGCEVMNNTWSGHTCTADAGGCYGVSMVGGYGGEIAGNHATFGPGSGASVTLGMSPASGIDSSVVSAAVTNAGTGYLLPPYLRLQDVSINGAYPVFTTRLSGSGLGAVSVAQPGDHINIPFAGDIARVQVIPATPAAITFSPAFEVGNSNARVHDNHVFGYGQGLVVDFLATGVHSSDNEWVHQNTWGIACGVCTDHKYTHDHFEEQGLGAIEQVSVSNTRGFEIDGPAIIRTVLPSDTNTTSWVGIALSGSPRQPGDGPWSVHNVTICECAASQTIASDRFQGIQITSNVPGARVLDTTYVSLAPRFGRAISASPKSVENIRISGAYARNADSDFYIPAAPEALDFSDNHCVDCARPSQISNIRRPQ